MRPLVLIPGIQGRWEWMQPAIDELAKEWRVIPCSLPGERGACASLNGRFDSFVDHIDSVLDAAIDWVDETLSIIRAQEDSGASDTSRASSGHPDSRSSEPAWLDFAR